MGKYYITMGFNGGPQRVQVSRFRVLKFEPHVVKTFFMPINKFIPQVSRIQWAPTLLRKGPNDT